MQLYYFLALILSLSFGSLPADEVDAGTAMEQFRHAALFTGLVIVAWWGLCYLSVHLVVGLIRREEVSCDVGIEWFDRHTECFRWFSLGLILLCLGGFGLGRHLEAVPVIGESLAFQAVVLMLPAVLMMAGVWASEYGFGVRLGLARRGLKEAARWQWTSLRCTIGWLIVPIIAVLASLDAVSLVTLTVDVPAWLFWCAMAAVAVTGVPWAVRHVFPTRLLDGEMATWIAALMDGAGLASCRAVVWQTGGRNHNAMIAGLGGRFRVLMVSDRLIAELPREELAMVILHEAAHATRYHVPLRIAALVPVWLIGGGLQHWLGQASTVPWLRDWSAMIGAGVSLVGTVVVLRLVSYASEHDADAVACRTAPDVARRVSNVPPTRDRAASVLASALRRVTADCPSARNPTWLHPGIDDRVVKLRGGMASGKPRDAVTPDRDTDRENVHLHRV